MTIAVDLGCKATKQTNKSISLKMLNKEAYNSVSDYFSDYLNTFKNLNMKFLIFVGILQV